MEVPRKKIRKVEMEGRDTFIHLGDGVYAKWDGYGVQLHANSHLVPTDRIYLEPEVLRGINRLVKRCREAARPTDTR